MDDCVVISLRRHGMTIENERHAYIGWTNSPLSKAGKEGVKRVASTLSPCHVVDLVYSSPLLRCIQTANILFPDHPIIEISHLKEMNFGSYEEKTYDELKILPHYQTWINHPFSERPEGGESFEEFSLRIEQGWEQIREEIITTQASFVTIITHGGVIRYLLTKYSPYERSFFTWDVPHVGGYDLTWPMDVFKTRGRCQHLQKVK